MEHESEHEKESEHEPAVESLADAFWSVAGTLRRNAHITLAPLGITPGQARALGTLHRHGTMRLSELSEHLHIAPRSATEVVDALEADGLVTREPDEHDRRATLVVPTPAGADLARAVVDARAAEADAFFGRLGDGDRAELRRILGVLRSSES